MEDCEIPDTIMKGMLMVANLGIESRHIYFDRARKATSQMIGFLKEYYLLNITSGSDAPWEAFFSTYNRKFTRTTMDDISMDNSVSSWFLCW